MSTKLAITYDSNYGTTFGHYTLATKSSYFGKCVKESQHTAAKTVIKEFPSDVTSWKLLTCYIIHKEQNTVNMLSTVHVHNGLVCDICMASQMPLFSYSRFSTDKPGLSSDKSGISTDNPGFSALKMDYLSEHLEYHHLTWEYSRKTRIIIGKPGLSTANARLSSKSWFITDKHGLSQIVQVYRGYTWIFFTKT